MQKNIPPDYCIGNSFGCRACEYFKKNKEEILKKLKEENATTNFL